MPLLSTISTLFEEMGMNSSYDKDNHVINVKHVRIKELLSETSYNIYHNGEKIHKATSVHELVQFITEYRERKNFHIKLNGQFFYLVNDEFKEYNFEITKLEHYRYTSNPLQLCIKMLDSTEDEGYNMITDITGFNKTIIKKNTKKSVNHMGEIILTYNETEKDSE